VRSTYREALEKLKPGQVKRLDYFGVKSNVKWDGPKFSATSHVHRIYSRSTRKTTVGELDTLKPAARNLIEDNIFMFSNRRSREILARLIASTG